VTVLRFVAVDEAGNESAPFDVTIPVAAVPVGKIVAVGATGAGVGTENSPWTLAQALAQYVPGDKIWLHGGVYAPTGIALGGDACVSARPGPATFSSYPGELAVIDDARATVGEIADTLREAFGEYREVAID